MTKFKLALILSIAFNVFASDLKQLKIKIAEKSINVEVADNDELRMKGLMYRKSLGPDSGMLFIFPQEEILGFWMKNTLIPLSIGYFDKNKKLIKIMDMEPASPMDLDPPKYSSDKPAQYALEVNKGWFKKNKIKLGEKLVF